MSGSDDDRGNMRRIPWRDGLNHESRWLTSTKLTEGIDRLGDLKLGNPTRRPPRLPCLESEKLARPAAASAIPEQKACMETSHHQGASVSLTSFGSLDNE
jgi:hypothetical protein